MRKQMTDQKKPVHENVVNGVVGWVAVAALAAWTANFLFGVYYEWGTTPNTDRGTFGDVFGAVNSLFSGFAFAGVIWTITAQQREMRRLHQETRKQDFKDTFYETLRAISENVSNVKVHFVDNNTRHGETHSQYTNADSPFLGRDGLEYILYLFRIELKRSIKGWDSLEKAPRSEAAYWMRPINDIHGREMSERQMEVSKAYGRLSFIHGKHVENYLQSVYIALNLIDGNDTIDKFLYATILRSRLSAIEVDLLMIHYASTLTTPEFNSLIDRYGMLQIVGPHGAGSHCLEAFNLQAFGNRREHVEKMLAYRKRMGKA